MDIEQIQAEIEKINNNPNLTKEEKKSRTTVYQTLLESSIQEAAYNEQMLKFIQGASEMENITKGSYRISDSLESNKLALKGNILESDLVKKLEENGIDEFTLSDLRTAYAPNYELEYGVTLTETNLAMELYEQIETVEKAEQNQMGLISRNLGDLLGKETVSGVNEIGIIQSDGKAIVKLIDKPEEQLQTDYQKAMAKIDELYVNEGVLDLQSKKVAVQMLNQLFTYYKNGNKKVPMDIVKQVEMSNNNQYAYDEGEKALH